MALRANPSLEDIGYGREEIADALAAQVRELAVFHGFSGMANEPSVRTRSTIPSIALVPGLTNALVRERVN